MGLAKIAGTLVLLGLVYVYVKVSQVPPVPVLDDTWWGPGERPSKEDTSVRPFKIDISDEVLKDLKTRLNNSLPFQEPLEDVNHHYGLNTKLLSKIVDYWKTKYDWNKRQKFLNQFLQFQTTIQGLKIHFLHVKPKNVPHGVQVLPLLILHGWPGSVREFYELIPILTTPQKGKNFVFEVIAPSLPGYAFSDGASKPGLGATQVGHLFHNLMQRLKFDRYYVQGGDWGSAIGRAMSILHSKNVIALHRNVCFLGFVPSLELLIGTVVPSLFFTEKEIQMNYPLADRFAFNLLEFGYMHLQATKPDTVGVALRESPVGLAAYIIEKFITWTNPAWKDLPDGGLTQKYTYDQLLDNVMLYWVTSSITTSVRHYAEVFGPAQSALQIDKLPIKVPSACNRFEHELSYPPEILLKKTHLNLIHLTDFSDGGHFAAFELPQVLGKDIYEFVEKVRNLALDKKEEL